MYILKGVQTTENSSCCLKVNRTQDSSELSIAFDNSLGASEKLFRIEMHVFRSSDVMDSKPIFTMYPANDQEIVSEMQDFINGKKY